jgi:hypothetical protein
MNRAKTLDEYYESLTNWKEEVLLLRELLKKTDLTEELKWGQ